MTIPENLTQINDQITVRQLFIEAKQAELSALSAEKNPYPIDENFDPECLNDPDSEGSIYWGLSWEWDFLQTSKANILLREIALATAEISELKDQLILMQNPSPEVLSLIAEKRIIINQVKNILVKKADYSRPQTATESLRISEQNAGDMRSGRAASTWARLACDSGPSPDDPDWLTPDTQSGRSTSLYTIQINQISGGKC